MTNPVLPNPYEISGIRHETDMEYTFRVATDIKPGHGQFLQLSIPKIGEVPISVSDQGDGWLEFTIRKVGKVTNVIFEKMAGDTLFMRGPYGRGWPMDDLRGKHLIVIAGGTGVSPVRSLLNYCAREPGFAKSVSLICGFRNRDSILFADDLAVWKQKFNTWFCLDECCAVRDKDWLEGFVTEQIRHLPMQDYSENYAICVVGPPLMMQHTGEELIRQGFCGEHIWLSFERKMSCAIGKCGHCRIDEVYVCLEGPVFPYSVAKNLVD